MRDMMGLMKQAQQMQQKMADMQAELDSIEVEGGAGGGVLGGNTTGQGGCVRGKTEAGEGITTGDAGVHRGIVARLPGDIQPVARPTLLTGSPAPAVPFFPPIQPRSSTCRNNP